MHKLKALFPVAKAWYCDPKEGLSIIVILYHLQIQNLIENLFSINRGYKWSSCCEDKATEVFFY